MMGDVASTAQGKRLPLALERSTIFEFGESTISMGHFPKLCNSHDQRDPEGIYWHGDLFNPYVI